MFQGGEKKTQSGTELDTRVRKVIRDDGRMRTRKTRESAMKGDAWKTGQTF
jgi:hypothetical protein